MSRTVQVKRDAITMTRIAEVERPPLGDGEDFIIVMDNF